MGNKANSLKEKSEIPKEHNEENIEVLYPNVNLKQEAYEIERKLFTYTKLLHSETQVLDIEIDHYGKNYIHTILCSRAHKDKVKKPTLVMIHGYQGTLHNYYRVWEYLVDHFDILSIDLLGMGLSSRPQVNFQSSEEYINFYIQSIEKWRIKLNINSFHLMGHSFGGYLSINYTLRYPTYVTKLHLLSPCGITDPETTGKILDQMKFGMKIGMVMYPVIWPMKLTLQDINGKVMFGKILDSGLKKRFNYIPEEENILLFRLFKKVLEYPKDLDKVLYVIFKNPMPSVRIPTEYRIRYELKETNIDIYYSKMDWMDRAGAEKLSNENPKQIRIFYLEDGDHTFQIEIPQMFSELFIENNRELIFGKTNKSLDKEEVK